MPSFVIHNVAGNILLKNLNISNEDKKRFIIGNLLPDSKSIKIDPNWTDEETRINVQNEKITTHFRTNIDETLEYPDIDLILNKYETEIRNNIVSLGSFFHLYADYYYFKYFLPKVITLLTKDMKATIFKKDNIYIRVNKTGKIMERKDFWSHINPDGIYIDYDRLNKYIVDNYEVSLNIDELYNFIDNNQFKTNIKELNSDNGRQVIETLESIIKDIKKFENEDLQIFDKKSVDNFITEIVDTFINKYGYLLDNYK